MKKVTLGNASSSTKKKCFAYILLIPFFLGFILFFLRPLFLSFYYSLNSMNLSGSEIVYQFQGFKKYYEALFVNASFRTELLASLRQLLLNVPMIMFFSLFIATLLNKNFYGRDFTRVILFLPVIISTGILLQIENSDYLMNQAQSLIASGATESVEEASTYSTSLGLKDLLLNINLPSKITEYMTEIINNFYIVLTSSGVQIVLLLAAWQSIPPSLYEASAIEGATAWEDFWKITIPMISPYIFVCTIYTIVDTFTSPNNSLVPFIQDIASGQMMDYGLASAMSWIYFLMVSICLGLVAILFLRGKLVVYQER